MSAITGNQGKKIVEQLLLSFFFIVDLTFLFEEILKTLLSGNLC